ncbi:MAG: hypothetical protein QXQ43_03330 [Nitrososphaerota archaeon]
MFESGYHIFIDGNVGLRTVKAQRTVDNKIELVQIEPVDYIVYEVGGADVTIDSPTYNSPLEANIVRFAGVRNGELLDKVIFINKEPDLLLKIVDDPGRYLYGAFSLKTPYAELAFDTSNFLLKTRPVNLPIEKQIMAYQEIEFGVYVLPIAIEMLPIDGQYVFSVLENLQYINYTVVSNPTIINVKNGEIVTDTFIDKVAINHDFERPDTLTYVAPDGRPIEGAIIRVFDKAEYDAGKVNNPVGATITDSNGRWKNSILVEAGKTYYVIFQKIDPVMSFGPDKVEIVVNYGAEVQSSQPQPPPQPQPPSGTEIHNEIIEGIDGFNRYFELKYRYVQGTLELILNGLSLTPGVDYVEVDDKHFLMSYAPAVGDILSADYTVK